MSRFPTYIVTAIPMEFRWDAVMVIVIAIILLCLLMKLVSMNKEIRKLNSKISQIQDNRSAEDKEQNVISSPNGKNIILLVEDEIETIDMLDRCLSKEYKIIKVSNGNDALTLALQGLIADLSGGWRLSWLMVIACELYMLYYALWGSKVLKTAE